MGLYMIDFDVDGYAVGMDLSRPDQSIHAVALRDATEGDVTYLEAYATCMFLSVGMQVVAYETGIGIVEVYDDCDGRETLRGVYRGVLDINRAVRDFVLTPGRDGSA